MTNASQDDFEECFDALQERFYIVVRSTQRGANVSYRKLTKRLPLREAFDVYQDEVANGFWNERTYIAHYLNHVEEMEVVLVNNRDVMIIKMPPIPKIRRVVM